MARAALNAGAALLIASACGALAQQQVMMLPTGGIKPPPVAQSASSPKDSPEEIAKDAARDLRGDRFYNKPGATRAQYDADWQQCRLIARGSATPTGTVPMVYNPAVISPIAAGVGGGIGAAIGAAIVEGEQRRANRRTCLMIRGWRMVEPSADEQARLTALPQDQRERYFDSIVGAREVDGKVTERTSFSQPDDPALHLDAPIAGPHVLFAGKGVDPGAPITLAPGEGALILAFRRPESATPGRTGRLHLARYDLNARDVIYRPRDWKKRGDKTTYDAMIASGDRNAPYELQIVKLSAGDYVIDSTSVGIPLPTTTNCFGAPTFHLDAGEVVYLGDFTPFWAVKLSTGTKLITVAYSTHFDEARSTLLQKQPELARSMKPAAILDRATYGCAGIQMDRWDLPGVAALAPPPPAPGTQGG